MTNKIECIDCDYKGIPNTDDGGAIVYCPDCESMNVITVFTLKQARKSDYNVVPVECPACKHIGEVEYNQGLDRFDCAWCGKTFKGKG